ncbi:MAG: MTH1187 family thiamine-binding protein [PVC group bacterium]
MIEVSVIPVGTKSPSLSHFVAGALRLLKGAHGVKYELNPMGTVIEGDLDLIIELAKKMHRETFGPEVKRVVTSIKIDDRSDQPLTMAGKLSAVWQKI